MNTFRSRTPGFCRQGRSYVWSLGLQATVPLIVFVVCALAMSQVGYAALFRVNNTDDAVDVNPGDGRCETAPRNDVCTLRAAIQETNALAGADTIVFDSALSGQTISLTSGPLSITSDLAIIGLGADALTIAGNRADDVFRIDNTSGIAVTFTGITITNGEDGIQIAGDADDNNVTVADSRIVQNLDDGLAIEGDGNTVTVTNTVVSDNGEDGIDIDQTASENHLTVADSTIAQQSPGDDGLSIDGVRNTVTVTNTVFFENEDNLAVEGNNNIVTVTDSTIRLAGEDGMEIDGDDNVVTVKNTTLNNNGLRVTPGGDRDDGIDVDGDRNVLQIEQVTFSGNGEDGLDIEGANNQVIVTHSTITGHGRIGLLNQDATSTSTIVVYNSIAAGNMGPDTAVLRGAAPPLVFVPPPGRLIGTFQSAGFNLVGNGAASAIQIVDAQGRTTIDENSLREVPASQVGFDDPGDQVGTATNPIDAGLGPLEDNGGPTLTHALLPGSPAIDAGDPNFTPPPAFDQRGPGFPQPRVQDGRIDIGAFEFGALPPAISFQDGVFPTPAYAGTRDTYLSEDQPTMNFCGLPTLRADGDDPPGTGRDLRTLLLWDLSAMPAGIQVTSATITINVTNPTGGTYELYRISSPWDECQVTWNTRPSRGMTVRGTVGPASTGTHTVTLNPDGVALVQSWVDDPTMNRGIMIVDSVETDGLAFNSREASPASNRPRLTITFD